MLAKKTDKSDLEKKKFMFFEIGLLIALAIALLAFEWSTAGVEENPWIFKGEESIVNELQMDITRPEKQQEIVKPELPKLKIRPDNIEIEEPDFNFSVEVDPWEGIYIPEPDPEDPIEDSIFIISQKMPSYRNGSLSEFHKHIQEIVKYPQAAIDLELQGKVFVRFVVDKTGYIAHIEIQQGIDPILDNAVIAAIKKSEKWQPGEQRGRPVNVAMSMPVIFRLQ